ncbi:MAG: class I SAM-dependent methyltransferase [Methylobacteriaceae bacterium]|nr:class I SAM-dependent methyltransferase [Methylobacteriaceae bacterium]
MTTIYDRMRYPSAAHVDTHPASLGALAQLCGLSPKRRAYRALEIGCGEGVNLIAMAMSAPESEFVGFDLAATAIDIARDTAARAGVRNVLFAAADLTAIGDRFGRFDYAVAHGVYAWTPPPVQDGLMALLGQKLAPGGLGMVSYNVRPGCHIRQVLRDELRFVTDAIADPDEKLAAARAFLEDRVKVWESEDPYRLAAANEAKAQLAKPTHVLFHDELGEIYAPQLFSDVVAHAARHGLAYVCDAHANLLEEAFFPGARTERARRWGGDDWLRLEQLSDFDDLRRFRRSIFTPAGAPIDRRFDPARLAGLVADADLARAAPDADRAHAHAFRTAAGGEIEIDDAALAGFLDRLIAATPRALALDDVARDADLAAGVARLFLGGAIVLRARPLDWTLTPGERPRASPLARALAAQGEEKVASLRGGMARLGDEGVRAFLMLLDGARTRDDIARDMAARMNVPLADAAQRTPSVLAHLARLGLMQA